MLIKTVNPNIMCEVLTKIYWQSSMSKEGAYDWCKRFQENVDEDVENDERPKVANDLVYLIDWFTDTVEAFWLARTDNFIMSPFYQ